MTQGYGYSDAFYTSSDGLRLHARIYGGHDRDALSVVCLPGLTRNTRDFHELALFLSQRVKRPRKVVAFDYRGRGQSAYDPEWKNYTVAVEAMDISDGLTALGIEHAAFIGTSRGGLILHVLAATRPAVLKAVVLNDIGPVVEGAGLAHIKAYLEGAPSPASLEDAVAIQRATHGNAFPALSDADWERMVGALYRVENGHVVADYDPALLRTVSAMDLSQPVPTLWPQFAGLCGVPMLAIRGGNSKLLSAETVAEMERRHPALRSITVAGQGHPPMLETGTLPEQIAAFLDECDAG